jgi:hypothetical protein
LGLWLFDWLVFPGDFVIDGTFKGVFVVWSSAFAVPMPNKMMAEINLGNIASLPRPRKIIVRPECDQKWARIRPLAIYIRTSFNFI